MKKKRGNRGREMRRKGIRRKKKEEAEVKNENSR